MLSNGKLITIDRHISEQQSVHPSATGELSQILRDLALAIRIISRDVRRAGLNNVLGITESQNVHGERVRKLDRYSDEVIFKAMDHGGHLCAMASEEQEGIIRIPDSYSRGKYVLLYDPLDGSSNIDVNVTVGTIFSVYRRITPDSFGDGQLEDLLQPGYRQVAAGYAAYGSSTILVYTTGKGVNMFTYDPTIGEFFLTRENLRIPNSGDYFSANLGNFSKWSPAMQSYTNRLLQPTTEEQPKGLRYVGSAIADVHRTLIYGGTFMYPSDSANPQGKLRLMYEANPLAMIIEQAGGKAVTESGKRILEITPQQIHERTSILLGSPNDIQHAMQHLQV